MGGEIHVTMNASAGTCPGNFEIDRCANAATIDPIEKTYLTDRIPLSSTVGRDDVMVMNVIIRALTR